MPRNSSGGVGGMFDDLKSRLGFGRNDDDYDDYDDYDDGEDDYDEYGYDYGYDDDEDGYGGGFGGFSAN